MRQIYGNTIVVQQVCFLFSSSNKCSLSFHSELFPTNKCPISQLLTEIALHCLS